MIVFQKPQHSLKSACFQAADEQAIMRFSNDISGQSEGRSDEPMRMRDYFENHG